MCLNRILQQLEKESSMTSRRLPKLLSKFSYYCEELFNFPVLNLNHSCLEVFPWKAQGLLTKMADFYIGGAILPPNWSQLLGLVNILLVGKFKIRILSGLSERSIDTCWITTHTRLVSNITAKSECWMLLIIQILNLKIKLFKY